jgi:hypothetical protein
MKVDTTDEGLGSRNFDDDDEQIFSTVGRRIYEQINRCTGVDQLDAASRLIWKNYDTIGEREAELLDRIISRRRPPGAHATTVGAKPLGNLAGRLRGRFTSRQPPRSPDRKASRDRRRTFGGSSALPDQLRHYYTEGQRAVLFIVAGETKRHGTCDLPIDKIAALAGVCRTTVQTTMHEARLRSHIKITERPRPGRKSLTNLVEVISPDWRRWIRRSSHRVQNSDFDEHHEDTGERMWQAPKTSKGEEATSP